MSVLVYVENAAGKFKKSTFEVVSYAKEIANQLGVNLTAISIGNISDDAAMLGNYGVSKVLSVSDEKYSKFNGQSYASAITEAAKAENATVVVIANSFSGKGLAPRVAVKLEAGYVDGAIALPNMSNGFVV